MATDTLATRHYWVQGRVQGVGFRHFVWREALERGIEGWVRNLRDGSVEVFVRAPDEVLDDFELTLGRGPRWGRVDALRREDEGPGRSGGAGFEIRSTA